MFMRVKQGSFFCDQHEFGEELDLRTAVDLAVVDPAVDRHGQWLGKILWRQGYRRVKN